MIGHLLSARLRGLAAVAGMILSLVLAGCGSGTGPCSTTGNALCGSARETYKLDFDHVDCYRMDVSGQPNAYIVQYVDKVGNMPVKIVVNAKDPPVRQGEEVDLMATGGTIKHTMPSANEFPEMKGGKIIFDGLGDIGGSCDGRFYITFVKTGSTLDGSFDATLKLLSAPTP
jgi:hypothetical protein